MTTVAWLCIVIGGLLIRQVAKGRAENTPGDLKDMFVGLVTGNFGTIQETLGRQGQSGLVLAENQAETALGNANAVAGTGGSLTGALLLSEVQTLGKAATGYTWGAVGPTRYDCSGIVWRAMQKLGYKGGRFTTFTFPSVGKKYGTEVSTPQVGDVAVWNSGTRGHMGVVSGPNQMYAARSTKTGIGFQTLSGPTQEIGVQPRFFRLSATP